MSAQDSAGRLKPSAAGSTPIERLRAHALTLPAALDRPGVQLVALAIIVAIAAFLRFYKLGAWSFWGDEMLTIIDVPDGFNYALLRRSLMLSTILAVIGELGVSEWSARLAPALVGVLSVPVLYYPVRRMLGPAVALLFALLLAVSPWHLYWSQNARYFILLLLFYPLALLFLYFGLHERRISFSLLGLLSWPCHASACSPCSSFRSRQLWRSPPPWRAPAQASGASLLARCYCYWGCSSPCFLRCPISAILGMVGRFWRGKH